LKYFPQLRFDFLVLLVSSLSVVWGQSQDTLDPFSRESICAFAAHLDAESDPAANSELARCLFLTEASDGHIHPELRSKRIQSLLNAGELELAHKALRDWATADSGKIPPELVYSLAKALVRSERDSLSLSILATLRDVSNQGNLPLRIGLLQGAAWLRIGKMDSTRVAIARASKVGGVEGRPYVKLLTGFADEYTQGVGKSKWLAGILSAGIPGLGKAYAGRKMDGLATFISIAFFGWQAYDGYVNDGSTSIKGAIFLASGVGLYLGNIYGSVRAIDVENDKRKKAFTDRVQFAVQFQFP
jgi:hypothetical protein